MTQNFENIGSKGERLIEAELIAAVIPITDNQTDLFINHS